DLAGGAAPAGRGPVRDRGPARGRLGGAREHADGDQPLPRGDDLARLLRRQHPQLDVRHRVDDARLLDRAEAAGVGEPRPRAGPRDRRRADHPRQPHPQHPDADLPVRGDQAVAGGTMNRAGPLRRMAMIAAATILLVAMLAPAAAADVRELALRVGPATRLLVVAPHPDDESLGSAGLIQRVLAAGGHVRVVLMTSGDAFPEGVKAETHILDPRPNDFRSYGTLRQHETIA